MCGNAIISDFIPTPASRRVTAEHLWPGKPKRGKHLMVEVEEEGKADFEEDEFDAMWDQNPLFSEVLDAIFSANFEVVRFMEDRELTKPHYLDSLITISAAPSEGTALNFHSYQGSNSFGYTDIGWELEAKMPDITPILAPTISDGDEPELFDDISLRKKVECANPLQSFMPSTMAVQFSYHNSLWLYSYYLDKLIDQLGDDSDDDASHSVLLGAINRSFSFYCQRYRHSLKTKIEPPTQTLVE
ncbi:hypothetical protein B296_00033403 [Ensete ventricosum]|uniref:Uncharacterized protein n=1 Tax=Ensete ventricosum TaxID=4639 RepID=A0A426YFG0_ENSVE|nr:hypothetical protein B296_00033403 [Ensete ventricosum]